MVPPAREYLLLTRVVQGLSEHQQLLPALYTRVAYCVYFLVTFYICKLWKTIGRILCVIDICNSIKGILCVIFCTNLIFASCGKILEEYCVCWMIFATL